MKLFRRRTLQDPDKLFSISGVLFFLSILFLIGDFGGKPVHSMYLDAKTCELLNQQSAECKVSVSGDIDKVFLTPDGFNYSIPITSVRYAVLEKGGSVFPLVYLALPAFVFWLWGRRNRKVLNNHNIRTI